MSSEQHNKLFRTATAIGSGQPGGSLRFFFALARPEKVTRELGLPLTVRELRAVEMSPVSANFFKQSSPGGVA